MTTHTSAARIKTAKTAAMAGETIEYSKFQPADRSRISQAGSTGDKISAISRRAMPIKSSPPMMARIRPRMGPRAKRLIEHHLLLGSRQLELNPRRFNFRRIVMWKTNSC